MPYVLQVEGKDFTTDDLTINEVMDVEKLTGQTWAFIDPMVSGRHWYAICLQFLMRSKSREDAEKELGQMKFPDAVKTIRFESEDDLPASYKDGVPKSQTATDEPATTGSSGAKGSSDGPPA